MHIQRVEIFHIALPLKKPFETSFGVVDSRPALIFKMTSDSGLVGYGESSPLYTPISEPETLAQGLAYVRSIVPQLIGQPIDPLLAITSLYEQTTYPVSVLGIEGAYLDLLAKAQGHSFGAHWGAKQNMVMVGESVSLAATAEEVVKDVEQYVRRGYTRVKVKIAPGRDVAFVGAVREAFPELVLGADANAAFTVADIGRLAELKQYDLAFVEQPFGPHDDEAHAQLRQRGIPVALDESVIDLASCERVVAAGACDIVNIKPARIGSYQESLRVYNYCVKSKIALFGGGRMETGVGKTANAHFYSLPGFTLASDLTPPLDYFSEDSIDPSFIVQQGEYCVPTTVGLGVVVQEERLRAHVREHLIYSR